MFTLVLFHCTCTSTYIVAQEPHDLVSALPFKVSPMLHLDPFKTLYSVT